MNTPISRHYARACKLGSVALAIATLVSQTQAITVLDGLNVMATVATSCTVAATGGTVNFGAYAPGSTHRTAPLDATGTITTNCTPGAAGYLTIGQGLNPGTGTEAIPVRRMASGVNRLGYQLYTETGRTSVWGNTSTTGVSVVGTGVDLLTTVYGRMPPGQVVPAGSYADVVMVTLTY